MPLSLESLEPLTSSTVEFQYCLDRPLRCLATRFVLRDQSDLDVPARTTCSLILCAGISIQTEAWLPLLKRLFHLTSKPTSRVAILSAWAIERPNHGDAGLLNEAMLNEHYRVFFPSRQYSAAIRAFLASDLLSERERANLMAVAHSGAGGSMYIFPFLSRSQPPQLTDRYSLLHWHSDCRPWNPRPRTFRSPASSWPKRRSSGTKPGRRCSSCTRSWTPRMRVARRVGRPWTKRWPTSRSVCQSRCTTPRCGRSCLRYTSARTRKIPRG
ncbi:hypothetical protein C8Q74DRAFT_222581 [Fomes fomentarius]|nr:hypothetical protein C8Q74DRAFT_222581 [Fomes fomentarius]